MTSPLAQNRSDALLPLAHELADAAGIIARQYFGAPLDIISKEDESPVTLADRSIEMRLREMIEAARPDDGILGEEFGPKKTRSGYTWVIDPIDGTKSFTIGRPTFGTLIGLCDGETPVMGIIDQPILGERWVGQTGEQTRFNNKAVTCRTCSTLKQAIVGTGSPSQIGGNLHDNVVEAARYMVYQGDCYFYGLMANGFIDAIIENKLGVYDFVALVPIVNGAGGVITDWQGRPKTLHGDATLLATGSKNIHTELLNLIR